VSRPGPSGGARAKALVPALLVVAAIAVLFAVVLHEPVVDPLESVQAPPAEAPTPEDEARIKRAVEARIRANGDGREERAISAVVVQGYEVTLIARYPAVEHESGRRAPSPQGLCRLPLARGGDDPTDAAPGVTEVFVHFSDGELWACSHILSM
jgi:hypothetical protein